MHLLSVSATNCRSTALIFYYQILEIQINKRPLHNSGNFAGMGGVVSIGQFYRLIFGKKRKLSDFYRFSRHNA